MSGVTPAVVLCSTYGIDKQMAGIAAEAARGKGVDVRLPKQRRPVFFADRLAP